MSKKNNSHKQKKYYIKNLDNKNSYIFDNTARKNYILASPIKRRKNNTKKYKIQKRNDFQINLFYVIFLSIMVFVMMNCCIVYLDSKSKIYKTKQEIIIFQNQLETLITKNDFLTYEISGYIDVNYIMQKAIRDLGMKTPNNSQIQLYKSSIGEYMEQYNNIVK